MIEGLPMDKSLDSVFEKLEKFLKSETVIGEPIIVGDITLIPIITVGFGCGGGSGRGVDPKGSDGIGGGIGIGAKITADAILVIKDGDVTLIPIKQKQNMEKLINMVPELIKKFDLKKFKDCCGHNEDKDAAEEETE